MDGPASHGRRRIASTRRLSARPSAVALLATGTASPLPIAVRRKGETGEHRLFTFLTTEPNDVIRLIHGKPRAAAGD